MNQPAREERGAIAILFAILLVFLMGTVGLVVDIADLLHARGVLQNAVDLGALAGARDMPVQDPASAAQLRAIAMRVARDNVRGYEDAEISIRFYCVVGDRDRDGIPDPADIPFVCGPRDGTTWPSEEWLFRGRRASHDCDPFRGDKCNTLVVESSTDVSYGFGRVVGVAGGSTGTVSAAACRGACGEPASPLDVVMVLDRTNSMSEFDLANAKNAALSILEVYDPDQQHVGLVGLPYHDTSNKCLVSRIQNFPNTLASTWILSPLSRDYRLSSGPLNGSSDLVSTIRCLERTPADVVSNPPGNYRTDVGDPVDAARWLLTTGRPDVPDVIILLSDGEANQPRFHQPCSYAVTRAGTAKGQGVTIYSIAYGVAAARCFNDTAGPYANAYASTFLADMSGDLATRSTDDLPGGCAADENTDGDHYFCESEGSDLEPVFRQVATAAFGKTRLIEL